MFKNVFQHRVIHRIKSLSPIVNMNYANDFLTLFGLSIYLRREDIKSNATHLVVDRRLKPYCYDVRISLCSRYYNGLIYSYLNAGSKEIGR